MMMSCRALALASSPIHGRSLSANPNPSSSRPQIRRSLRIRRCSSSLRESSSSLDLPLLPFQSDEVLIPSESKTLHLYEARFLALLEEILQCLSVATAPGSGGSGESTGSVLSRAGVKKRPNIENGKNPGKYIKYTPEDLDRMLGEFFDGRTGNEQKR